MPFWAINSRKLPLYPLKRLDLLVGHHISGALRHVRVAEHVPGVDGPREVHIADEAVRPTLDGLRRDVEVGCKEGGFLAFTQARQTAAREVRIPGSVTRWARLMNVSRLSPHRELAKLEAAGVISYAPPTIGKLDAGALQGVLGR